MNNLLTTIAVCLVIILSALFALPVMINWDDYRGDFEVRLSEILGSKVELDGSLNVRFLPTPYLRVENLRLGESGVKGKPVLDVKEMTLWVAVPPLLKGIIEASRLTLDEPRLFLQFDKNGRATFKASNSKVSAKRLKKSRAKKIAGSDSSKGDIQTAVLSRFKLSPNLISLKDMRIKNGTVLMQTLGAKGTARQFELGDVEGSLSAVTLNGPFHFIGNYKIKDSLHKVRLALGVLDVAGEKAGRDADKAPAYPLEAKLILPGGQRFEFLGQLALNQKSFQVFGKLKAGGSWLGGTNDFQEQLGGTAVEASKIQSGSEEDLPENELVAKLVSPSGAPPGGETGTVLTSAMELSALGVQFKDIVLRGGNLAQPQTVRGNVNISWQKDLSLHAVIDGQAIDLNMIYGSPVDLATAAADVSVDQRTDVGAKVEANVRSRGSLFAASYVRPGSAFLKLSDVLLGQAALFERIDLKARVAQVVVGHGEVRNFRLAIKSKNGLMQVEEFYGRLPGSGRVSLKGAFSAVEGVSEFDGSLYLRGLQFEKLLNWAAPDAPMDGDMVRGKYMLSGRFLMNDAGFSLQEAYGDIGGARVRGGLTHVRTSASVPNKKQIKNNKTIGQKTSRGIFRLRLNAGEVVLADLLGRDVLVKDYKKALASVLELGGVVSQKSERDFSAEVDFNIEKLVFSDASLKDVALNWRADQSSSGLSSLSFMSEQGLRIIYGNDGKSKTHRDHFVIEAKHALAVNELVQLAGFEEADGGSAFDKRLIAQLLPMRLAVTREPRDTAMLYRVDGVMGGSDTAFSLLVPGKGDGASITLFGGMENKDGAKMASILLPFQILPTGQISSTGQILQSGQADGESYGRARLTFAASGTQKTGFKGQLRLEDKGFSLSYDGAIGVSSGQFATDGTLNLEGERSREVLSMFGLGTITLNKNQQGPFKAQAAFVQTNDGYAISDLKVALGDTIIKGTGLMEEGADGPSFRLALATEELDVRSLFAPLEVKESDSNQVKQASLVKTSLWSSRPFGTKNSRGSVASNRRGSVSLALNELQLTDQLSLENAQITWAFDGDRIEISKISGRSLGGLFEGSGTLRPTVAGYSFNGLAHLTGGRLEEVGARSELNMGSGEFSLNLSLSGSGVHMNELVSSLAGEGVLTIKAGKLRQLSPKILRSAARGYLEGTLQSTNTVEALLVGGVEKAHELKLGNVDIGLQLLDGTLKLKQDDLRIRPGRIGIEAALKFEDLSWRGDWTIRANEAAGALSDLPPVYRRLKGKLTDQGPFHSELDAGDFLRSLDLKSKETELKRLEKVRLQEVARQLAEQRRAAEAELERIEAENQRLQDQQKQLDDELERTLLPPL